MEPTIEKKDADVINNVAAPVEAKDLSTEVPIQEEILIQVKEKQKEEKVKVNARDNSFLNKIIATPKEQPGGGTGNVNDAKSRLAGDSATPLNNATSSSSPTVIGENESTSELVIEILDWLLVAFITWYAEADNSRPYETDVDKKKILKKYLAKYLDKKASQYPVEYFLLAAFVSTYFISARKAHADKKVNHQIKEAKVKAVKEATKQEAEKKKRKLKQEPEFVEAEVIK